VSIDLLIPVAGDLEPHACDTLVMRLNAWLARAGVASRRGADELIKAGRVLVNGEPGQLNTVVESSDRVELDGVVLSTQGLAYVLLHKPMGVVTTARDPGGRPTVVDLVDHPTRVVPVGRLDIDTTGVLLLTNDGELAHRLAHPSYEVDKVYVAEVEGDPDEQTLAQLAVGIELEDGMTAPAVVRRLGPGRVELTIHEGRNRQVKRMLERVGHPVKRLRRTRYGLLTIDGLASGEWRELTPKELAALRLDAPSV
jgi:23S rRNA pseudouridine2605 synthase